MESNKYCFFRLDPGAGHLITFSQFVFIALHGYIFTSKFGTVKTHIPKRDYLILVLMFFLTSVVNNWAFNFNIPVPLHMIFRAVSMQLDKIYSLDMLDYFYPIEFLIRCVLTFD